MNQLGHTGRERLFSFFLLNDTRDFMILEEELVNLTGTAHTHTSFMRRFSLKGKDPSVFVVVVVLRTGCERGTQHSGRGEKKKVMEEGPPLFGQCPLELRTPKKKGRRRLFALVKSVWSLRVDLNFFAGQLSLSPSPPPSQDRCQYNNMGRQKHKWQ